MLWLSMCQALFKKLYKYPTESSLQLCKAGMINLFHFANGLIGTREVKIFLKVIGGI